MIADWAQDTVTLFNQVSEWSHQNGWTVEPEVIHQELPNSKETLEVDGLSITTPSGRIQLEPIGRRADGSVVVEMYAWPTLYRVRLLGGLDAGEWKVLTDSGIMLRQAWNRVNFTTLAEDLLNAV